MYLKQNSPDTYEKFAAHPWIKDGLDKIEAGIVEELLFMATRDGANFRYAVSLLKMPFLAQPDPSDYNAALALYLISQTEPSQLATIMRHATLAKGITDAWTPVVATLHSGPDKTPLSSPSCSTADG